MIAPWLTANNPLEYMRAGAGVGLQLRAAALAEQQAQAQQEEFMARIAASQQQHADALAARQAEQAAQAAESLRSYRGLEAYRGTEEEHRKALEKQAEVAQALRERHQNFLEKAASAEGKDIQPKPLSMTLPSGKTVDVLYNPKTGHFSDYSQDKGISLSEELPDIKAKPAVAASEGIKIPLLGTWGAHPASPAIEERTKRVLRRPVTADEVNSLRAPIAASPLSAASPSATSPFQEGATIRNKTNGKLYKVLNGVPVEIQEGQ
jgi:hypothetical protein